MPLTIILELWLPLVVAVAVGALGLLLRGGVSDEAAAGGRGWPGGAKIGRAEAGGAAIGAAAMAGALAALHVMMVGRIVWPPPGLTERLLPMIVLAGAGGCVAALAARWWSRALVAFVTCSVSVGVVVWPMLTGGSGDGRPLAGAIVLMAGGLAAVSAGSLSGLERGGHPFAAATVLSGLGLAGGGGLLGSGSMKLGQFALGAGVAALTWLLLMAVRRWIRGVVPVGWCAGVLVTGSGVLAGLLVAGNRYGELRAVAALLSGCAAPLAWLTVRSLRGRAPGRVAGFAAVGVAALVAGLAAGLAIDLPDEAESAYSDAYGY